MKHLLLILALLVSSPAITRCANYQVYSFNLDSLVSVEIVIFDSLQPDTNKFDSKAFLEGTYKGIFCYYRSGPGTATGIVTFLFVPAGLLLALVFTASPPYPEPYATKYNVNLNNPAYAQGFRKGLAKAKRRSVWNSFLKGWAAAILFGLVFIVAGG